MSQDLWTCPICKMTQVGCGNHWQHIEEEHPKLYKKIVKKSDLKEKEE